MAIRDVELLPQYDYLVSSGYEALVQPSGDYPGVARRFADASDTSKAMQEQYLLMHKVLVGRRGGEQLESIYDSLRGESQPYYLSAAGWAATEAALVRSDMQIEKRIELLHGGIECWVRALRNQKWLNANQEGRVEHSLPYRIALDIAVTPLLEGVIMGEVTRQQCERAFEDCLNVAQANAVRIDIIRKTGNHDAIADHIGFGYECNALLAFNRRLSETWFVIPSSERSDSGHHYREQTHDLSVVHQKWGEICSVTPVEVKASITSSDRRRYRALLVGGKMHLAMPDQFSPEHTLSAIAAVHDSVATEQEREIADTVSDHFTNLVKRYHSGNRLGEIATTRSSTLFRDDSYLTMGNLAVVGAWASA